MKHLYFQIETDGQEETSQGVTQVVVCSLGTNIMNKVDSTTQRGKFGKPKTFYFILLSTGNTDWRPVVDSH